MKKMSLAEGEANFDADKSLVVVNIEAQLIHLQTERDALINEKQALKEEIRDMQNSLDCAIKEMMEINLGKNHLEDEYSEIVDDYNSLLEQNNML
jgi:uncharacterized coiled-coil DUF342 family protein